MALFRKLFYRKPPDGLLEICERVYVFDCCFTTNVLEEDNFKVYMHGIVGQLRDHFPDASFLVFNFHEANAASLLSNILSEYDMTIMDYPRQFEGCPVLPMEMLHHFLRSCESWLSSGQQNLLLMHCQRGAWPVLAFMLGALLIYRKQYSGEQKTLEMIYKQAPRELLHSLSPVNPVPSQLRYLQYVSRRNVATEWPPSDRGLNLECVIIRFIPNFDGEGGCRPMFRIYGPDPLLVSDKSPKVLYSTPKRSKFIRAYKQAECGLVKIDINCHIQGDVVVECISLSEDMEQEKLMFRVMFNTAFIRSNILMLNRDEIDMLWNAKDQFPKEFRSEILLSDMDTAASVAEVNFPSFEEKDGLPVEAFSQVQEMFSHVDWSDPNSDAALYALHQFGSPKFNTALQERYSLLSPMKVTPTKHMPKTVQVSMDSPSVQSSKRSPRADVSNDNKPQTLQISPTSSSPCSSSGEATPLKASAFAQAVSWVYDTLEARGSPSSPSTPSRTSPSGLSCTSAAESLSSEPTQLSFTSAAESLSSDPSQSLSRKESDIDSIDGFKSVDSSPPAVASSAPPFPVPPTSEKVSSTPPSPDPVVASSTPTPAITPRTSPPVPTTEPSTLSFTPSLGATGSSIQPRPSPLTPPPLPPAPPSAEVSVSRVGSHPSPPQPSSKAPPVKEVIGRVGQYPPPLPPPPPTVTLKEVSSVSGWAPPPPPLNSKQAASPNPSSGPPPPPPPAPSGKGVSKTNSGAPPPPCIAPPNGHLSRMMNSKNNQRKKLKPLHWLKLTRAVQGSLWAEAQKKAAKAPEIDISELETLFSAAMPNADKEKGAQRAKQAPKSEKVQLVDHRRAYNCEIMLSKVKVPLHELMGSVLTLEDSALDENQVDNLIKFCPTKEEMEQLKGYTGDQDKLGKCEQFFLELMKVPRVESKLRVFSFKIQFKSQVSDLRSSLSVINSVTEEIRSSAKLRSIMQTILTLGNALNQGTARGSAVGFRLDSLLKLTDTRSIRNSKMTLMHYLCKVLSEKLPELLDFSNGIASLESAARIQLKFLAEEMQAISKGLEKVVQELSISESDGPVSETFRKILKEFLCYAEAEVRSLAALYSGVGRNVDALILYFGEDPARCPFEQVIATLLNFVRTFNRAHEENCKQRELELKKAQKAEAEKKSPRDSQRVLQTQLQTNNVKSEKLVGDNTVDFVAYER